MFFNMWTIGFLLLAAIVLAIVVSVHTHKQRRKEEERAKKIRLALDEHPETIMVCLRSYQNDGGRVGSCIADMLRRASSPLRLRFAIVQEDTPQDVFSIVQTTLRHDDFTHMDMLSKIRTGNVIRSSYLHAWGTWVQMYGGERYVVCADPWNTYEENWDVTLVQMLEESSENMVLTGPGGNQFPTIVPGSPEQNWWPVTKAHKFVFDPQISVASLTVSHHFMAFWGTTFGALRVPETQVPLFIVDVVLSDLLYEQGLQFETLSTTIFHRMPNATNFHLYYQRPALWDGDLDLSQEYMDFAGIKWLPNREQYVMTARAQLGLTDRAKITTEGRVKYGSLREMQQQYHMFEAALAKYGQA